MKNNIAFILSFLLPLILIGQIPQSFNYQAVVRNAAGEIQYNTTADFKIEILRNDTIIYSEEHLNEETGSIGVVNFKVGLGDDPIGDFSEIDWSQGPIQIRVHLKLAEGQEEEMGTADIVAVPFALYAQNSGNSYWTKKNNSTIHYDGVVQIGVDSETPPHGLVVRGGTTLTHPYNNTTLRLQAADSDTDVQIRSYKEDNTPMWRINMGDRNADNLFRIRPENDNGSAFVILPNGRVGINTLPQNDFHVSGQTKLVSPESHKILRLQTGEGRDAHITSYDEDDNSIWTINMNNKSNENRFTIASEITNDLKFWIDHSDNTHVKVLQIHGGGDGAEYFNIKKSEQLEPGSLVIIDEDSEGKLKISTKSYDRRIAGVISGAGGVQPGITLEQREVLEGDELVSLWGRVYVKATTENGEIKPGDLLTSSNLEGHVMKVTKKRKSRGAIIGKALSRLDEGEGLVLILIQHQ
jgi:hypothetical protein